ncbi:uncharacterized protein BDR25DRAFT_361845 [Lindgomyces ingoldianus]|uniref:Uncharacterized protein n=1 Tax=Lindgomyces ingoldianus TaxID=673940 RepID=A0ACB6QCL5_9PLEO|nr:uncharacterized protein BDR25DRAFT_361845 [Lindgomyces ingoldianus]KAF2464348.1 hypothetical protein BDR25DRAFT_361845 [Lindgomyces ingoldianus]
MSMLLVLEEAGDTSLAKLKTLRVFWRIQAQTKPTSVSLSNNRASSASRTQFSNNRHYLGAVTGTNYRKHGVAFINDIRRPEQGVVLLRHKYSRYSKLVTPGVFMGASFQSSRSLRASPSDMNLAKLPSTLNIYMGGDMHTISQDWLTVNI